MKSDSFIPHTGGCDCGQVRYQVNNTPLFVHCCHCTWCQRESGAAFAINGLIESHEITVTGQAPVLVDTPTPSGRGQKIARCANCQLAVWSHYMGMGQKISFIKVGTLDEPERMSPDIHIYIRSKHSWVELPADVPAFAGYYDRKKQWPAASLDRWQQLRSSKS